MLKNYKICNYRLKDVWFSSKEPIIRKKGVKDVLSRIESLKKVGDQRSFIKSSSWISCWNKYLEVTNVEWGDWISRLVGSALAPAY